VKFLQHREGFSHRANSPARSARRIAGQNSSCSAGSWESHESNPLSWARCPRPRRASLRVKLLIGLRSPRTTTTSVPAACSALLSNFHRLGCAQPLKPLLSSPQVRPELGAENGSRLRALVSGRRRTSLNSQSTWAFRPILSITLRTPFRKQRRLLSPRCLSAPRTRSICAFNLLSTD
jgi:hypothetical protein